ncbi:MAG TPA: ABC transporter permease [Selenomonadales bacterium]|nr:ABC transporter permease [Selenomonadales bacterium]
MLKYTIERFLSMLLVILIIITITFLLMHAIPGGPFTGEKNLPPAVIQNIMERYKLNDPLWKQYVDYLGNIVRGDFGPSFKYEDRTVNQIIADGLPISAVLGFGSAGVSILLGIPAGIIAALRQNKWPDYAVMFAATIGISVPNFITATLLIYVLALKLELLPAAMWGGIEYAIMPILSLAAYPTAVIARLTRASMLDVLGQDYIRTAKAKGLSTFTIIWRHTLKNALMPVVTYLGPMIAFILLGSFVVESIFAIPGLGRYFVMSIYNRDYTTILGVTILDATMLVVFNFLVDIAYVFLDPRIKLDGRKDG